MVTRKSQVDGPTVCAGMLANRMIGNNAGKVIQVTYYLRNSRLPEATIRPIFVRGTFEAVGCGRRVRADHRCHYRLVVDVGGEEEERRNGTLSSLRAGRGR